ncbi:NUDIX hydrolase [Lachnoclostridium sp. Marseille-P6806]|uniref:NUDIX hydrolase n=1 Tax=Lachnoclostridium sp. Marseille-P6806 TaxID=2364793 RepID=UPI001030B3D9|nr:NUDIX hydrolase [Lachnoclostridium sp. Marseille-P6806]
MIQRRDRTLACRGTIVDFYRDTVVLPDGHTEEWDYVRHKRGGGAAAVPVLPDGRIILIRQYRQAIDAETLELPAGTRDSEEEPSEETARRELLEETGYAAERFVRLAQLKTAVAYCSETVDVYLAENVSREGEQRLDATEDISFAFYELGELLDRIRTGEICDAKTVAGILAYAEYRQTGDGL